MKIATIIFAIICIGYNNMFANDLFESVVRNDTNALKKTLKIIADINQRNFRSKTALMASVEHVNLETTRILLSQGAFVNEKTKNNETALMMAFGSRKDISNPCGKEITDIQFIEKRKEIIEMLISKGAEINNSTSYGATPLMFAVQTGRLELVQLMIEHGADVNEQDYYGETALMMASNNGFVEIAEILIENDAKVNHISGFHATPLMKAIVCMNFTLSSYPILDSNYWINTFYNEESNLFSRQKIARLLINNGADVNATLFDGSTTLMQAIMINNIDFLRLLIEHGADVNVLNSKGETALLLAAENGNNEIVEYLLNHGAKYDKDYETIYAYNYLMAFTLGGFYDQVLSLLQAKSNPNRKDFKGFTALTYAIISQQHEIAKLLIKNGAEINSKDNAGFPLLSHAVAVGDEEMCKYLLEKGAIVDESSFCGITALMIAVQHGHQSIVKLLLEKDASVHNKPIRPVFKSNSAVCFENKNSHERLGSSFQGIKWDKMKLAKGSAMWLTTLNLALLKGYSDIAQLLIEYGATYDVNFVDHNGNTYLMGFCRAGMIEYVKVMINSGADISKKNCSGETAFDIAKRNHRKKITIFLEKINKK